MLRVLSARNACRPITRIVFARSAASVHNPNTPLELDPSYRVLLNDIDMSVARHKSRHTDSSGPVSPRELELYPNDPSISQGYLSSAELDAQDDNFDLKEHRKSPAALFGSQRIGAVILPVELQNTISRLISGMSFKNTFVTA